MINKLTIAVDLDGVCRNIHFKLVEEYNKKYHTHFSVEDITDWDLTKTFGKDIYNFMFEEKGKEIFLDAKPTEDVIEGLSFLNKLSFVKEVFILTTQPNITRQYAFQWVGEYNLPVNKVIVNPSSRDTKTIREKNGYDFDILIDDSIGNLAPLLVTHKIPICFVQPWNEKWNELKIFGWQDLIVRMEDTEFLERVIPYNRQFTSV